jgi:transcriptional regulator with XRE-family HTH domain
MSIIREIREMTGLSLRQMAEWFDLSKSMIHLAEKEQRNLDSKTNTKLYRVYIQLKDLQKNRQEAPATLLSNPAALAERHRKKMEFYERSAQGLRLKMAKLAKDPDPTKLQAGLLSIIRNSETEWVDEQDKAWAGMMGAELDWRSRSEQQEKLNLLQDKIETNLAYAELHRKRWGWYEGLANERPGAV